MIRMVTLACLVTLTVIAVEIERDLHKAFGRRI